MPEPNIQKIYSSFAEVRDMNSIELNRFDIYFLFESHLRQWKDFFSDGIKPIR